MVETSDQWIIDRTGIEERHIAADDETTSTLALAAARMALERARIDPDELDLIVAATTTPDGLFPSVASLVQEGLGAHRAGAFDVNAACMGFMSALATGTQFIGAGSARRVLVIGAEVLSRIVNWQDRGTCVLFGDGAGAVVLEAAEFGGPLSFVLRSDGARKDHLFAPGMCGPRDAEGKGPLDCYIQMDGPAIFKFAVHAMTDALRATLAEGASDAGRYRPAGAAPGEPAHHPGRREGARSAAGTCDGEHPEVRQHVLRFDPDGALRGGGSRPHARRGARCPLRLRRWTCVGFDAARVEYDRHRTDGGSDERTTRARSRVGCLAGSRRAGPAAEHVCDPELGPSACISQQARRYRSLHGSRAIASSSSDSAQGGGDTIARPLSARNDGGPSAFFLVRPAATAAL